MKIGVCTSPDKMQLAAELGYDYIEPNFRWMTGLDDQAFAEMTAMVQASPIKAEAFCIFFPGGSKLYALDGDQEPLLESIAAFAEKGFSRAAMWGGKVAVIGSGYVRGIPEGMTREETERQFAKVLAVLGEIACGELPVSANIRGDKADSRGVKTIEHYHQKTADDNAPLHLADRSSIDQCL